jgi:hypothetical protein
MSLIKPVGSITWVASIAPDVVGYKIFWTADGTAPTYTSSFIDAGNVTTMQLPFAGMEAFEGTLQIGVASVDATGNVSDITTPISVPLDSVAPDSPTGVTFIAG